jgi:hypothetical protein
LIAVETKASSEAGELVKLNFLVVSKPPHTRQHFSLIQGAQTRRKRNHTRIPTSQQNTYYINTKLGRTPKKYTSVEETNLHTTTISRQNIRKHFI